MKYLLLLLSFSLMASTVATAQTLDQFFQNANGFFSTHVANDKIDYQSIKNDPAQLNKLVNFIKNAKVEEYNEAQRKAFGINSYNIMVVKTAIDNYPLKSPLDVTGFFDGVKHTIAGKKTTLNNYEKKELLTRYNDARLHFVLVCAAISCPPIANFAYMPDQLEKQLDMRTKAAINNTEFIKVDEFSGDVSLSKIFEWYAADFKPNATTFINKYRTTALPEGKSTFYPYNWTLNDKSTSTAATDNSSIEKPKSGKAEFAPIIAAATLPKGKFEINNFNTIYTADYEGDNTYSGLTGLFYFTYGINGRFDVSLDFIVSSNRFGDAIGDSPFKPFDFQNTPDNTSRPGRTVSRSWGLSAMGPRVRFSPFKKLGISFDQAFYFPVKNIPFNNAVNDRMFWVTQIYYDKQLNPKLGLFIALTFWQPISLDPQVETQFQVPYLRGFLTWFATNRFSLYATTTLFTEWGVGAKFLLTPQFEIQALYSYYVPIPGLADIYTQGSFNVMTFNLGLRYRI
ncbi:MAG: DUF547 domain-containing protein [Aureispira sp.]